MKPSTASPALQPPAGNERFPLVDGLRAIAALSVVVYHVGLVSGLNEGGGGAHYAFQRLNVGVTLFFVISGFLLYRPYVNARLRGTPRPTARQFFRRRLLRIVPAYWAALAILVV